MSKVILKELPALVDNDVISEETAEKIRAFYEAKTRHSSNRLLIVFSIIGALLTGLGIILIVAHNWDELSRPAKLFFAFLPMLIGQVACGYLLFKRPTEQNWKEAAAVFLFFSIAASISIVSQVYNIEGSLSGFLFTWMFLALPLIYIMRSSVTSLLFIIGITWYACELSYFSYPRHVAWWYWPLLMAVIPHYYSLVKKPGNFLHAHSWILGLSIVISLGSVAENHGVAMWIAYMSLLSAFVSLGRTKPFREQHIIANAFRIIGSAGIIGVLLTLTFRFSWELLSEHDFNGFLFSGEFTASAVMSVLAALFLFSNLRDSTWQTIDLKSYVFILFIIFFVIGMNAVSLAQALINLTLFALALFTIVDGTRKDNLGILNYGLLILTALIVCRFFDTDLSFVVRGLLFVAVGAGFFGANFYIIRKRNKQVA